jgi:hypothetical protein
MPRHHPSACCIKPEIFGRTHAFFSAGNHLLFFCSEDLGVQLVGLECCIFIVIPLNLTQTRFFLHGTCFFSVGKMQFRLEQWLPPEMYRIKKKDVKILSGEKTLF